jgi:hypothetical protein
LKKKQKKLFSSLKKNTHAVHLKKMSTSTLKAFKVVDPRVELSKAKSLAIFQGGKQINVVANISTSFSPSSITFSAPPPNPGTILDRVMWLGLPVRLTFTGTSTNPANIGQSFLRYGTHDALRAFPLQRCIATTTVTFNNTSLTINSSDVLPELLRYNSDQFDENFMFDCPALQDVGTNYDDWIGTNQNVLSGVLQGANMHTRPRGVFRVFFPLTGAFPIPGLMIADPATGGAMTNVANPPIVAGYIIEPLILSPFIYNRLREGGLTALQTLQFTFTMGSYARMWSHANSTGLAGNRLITGVTGDINGTGIAAPYENTPKLFFTYITPQLTNVPPTINVYNYYQVDRYPSTIPNLAPNTTITVASNNVQLNSIPNCIFVYARDNNQVRDAPGGCALPDAFTAITAISVNWNNNAGLLSSATCADLYHIAKKNGCRLTYEEWYGETMNGNGAVVPTTGGMLRLQFGEDIGLNENEAPGLLGTYQLQINMTIRNQSTVARDLVFMVVVVSQGIITIGENRSVTQIGVITQDQILNSASFPQASYTELQSIYGGNIWDSVKKFFSNVKTGIREAAPIAKTLWSAAKVAAPIVAPLVGLGFDGSQPPPQDMEVVEQQQEQYDEEGMAPGEANVDLSSLRGSGFANPSQLFRKRRKTAM